MGKPVGSDVVQGAGAFMAQNGRQFSSEVPAGPSTTADAPDPIADLLNRLRESGAVDVALAKAYDYATEAREALRILPNSAARQQLDSLVDLVVNRQR